MVPARLRPILAKVTLLAASSLVVLVLAELTLRVATPARKSFHVWPPGMYHVFHPNRSAMPDHSSESTFTTNSLGLRGPEPGDDRELRILAIGGSTTELLRIDDSRAWPLLLARLVGPTPDNRRVWSASAGRSGMNSVDHITHARFLVPQLPRIDVVVALIGVNDLTVALATPEAYAPVPADIPFEQAEPLVRRAFQQVPGRLEHAWDYDSPFYKKLALYQLLRSAKRARSRDLASVYAVTDDAGTSTARWRSHRRKAPMYLDELPDMTAAIATYKKNLNTFVDILRARSIRVILITQPTLWRDDLSPDEENALWMGGRGGDFMKTAGYPYYTAGALAAGMVKLNEAMLSVCADRDVECVDLAPHIRKDLSSFHDDCHFGNEASEKIAEIVAEQIKKGGPIAM